jgi:hypothetical protein
LVAVHQDVEPLPLPAVEVFHPQSFLALGPISESFVVAQELVGANQFDVESVPLPAHWASRRKLLSVEDLHWCDASSIELIERLLDECATVSIMFLLTFRAEFDPP